MTWNYRVLAHKEGDEVYFQIHEVYYEEKHLGYTENGVTVGSEDVEGIKWVLDLMRECLEKPILSVEDFPNEYKPEENE